MPVAFPEDRPPVSLQNLLRQLPSVDALATDPALAEAVARHGRPAVVAQARRELDALRARARGGDAGSLAEQARGLQARVAAALDSRAHGSLVEVLNATGVVVHTNLGRAPLGDAVLERVARRAAGATNLELDLATGRRGKRAEGCEALLAELAGAEAACIVNNCAAGLVLALNTFAAGKGVLVSRGELVEIGGSFRIPAICERSGARLVEVGTTNRTRLADYEKAVTAGGIGLILKVHPSNFRVVGFTEEASLADLAGLGRKSGVPVFMDQGTGALEDLAPWGVADEPPVPAMVAAGADVVCFSGDKLLGGPQAGCLVGRRDAIAACRENPLYRALRVGRLVTIALEATLWAHATGRLEDIPVQAQLRLPKEAVRDRADAVRAALAEACARRGLVAEVVEGDSTSGGGSSPQSRIPTFVLRVSGPSLHAEAVAARLRAGAPAVIARITADALHFDLRTVPPAADGALRDAILAALP